LGKEETKRPTSRHKLIVIFPYFVVPPAILVEQDRRHPLQLLIDRIASFPDAVSVVE
jgi:hypothetical protein